MRTSGFIYTCLFLLTTIHYAPAQDIEKNIEENSTTYRIEAFGSVATGSQTPLWMVSNRYGIVPLDANNGYLRAGAFHNQQLGKGFHWEAGLDIVGAAPRYRNVYVQQIYAELGYKSLLLSIGSNEKNHVTLWDKKLSSGDMVQSINARPIPEINLSIPNFTIIPYTKGIAQIKGDFAVGKSFDTRYLEKFVSENQVYVTDVLWHHKSLYLQFKDTRNGFPLSFALGGQHWAQWGGTSTRADIGKQPQSLKDFIRIVAGKEGGADATQNDIDNALGNHYGSYDFRLSYSHNLGNVHAYHQRFFDDKSGMEFANRIDGLWGLEFEIKNFPWVKKVLVEMLETRDQSGPLHYIGFDHQEYPGRGGGNDNYYNNGEYVTGVSYFNRSLGSPLLPSPEYNEDGTLGFKSNRIKSWHLGIQGNITQEIGYRFLFTANQSWGTHARPFLNKRTGTSTLAEIVYTPICLDGWEFTGAIAGDTGNVYGNSKGIGFSIGVVKRGIIKNW